MASGVVLPVPSEPYNPRDPQSATIWNNYWLSLRNVAVDAAPTNAQFWVSVANSILTNERNLGALSTGFVFITVAAGIAVPSSVGTIGLARGGTHADLSATGGVGQVLKQVGAGADVTVGVITAADLAPLSNVYTPNLTNVTNLGASTAFQCQYVRVGNMVTVTGKVAVDPTAAGATELGISLPIASNFAAAEDCGGVAFASGIAGQGAAIYADPTNDRASMQWVAVDVTNQPMGFTFSYRVI